MAVSENDNPYPMITSRHTTLEKSPVFPIIANNDCFIVGRLWTNEAPAML